MASPNDRPNVFDAPAVVPASFYKKPPKTWVDALKLYVRDFASDNILLNQLDESTVEQYEMAWGLALDWWNNSSPRLAPVGYLSHPFRSGLMWFAAAILMRSVVMRQMRNELDFTDGGVAGRINTQWKNMLAWAEGLHAEAKEGMARVKTELNSSLAWGGSSSEFGAYFPSLNRSSAGAD